MIPAPAPCAALVGLVGSHGASTHKMQVLKKLLAFDFRFRVHVEECTLSLSSGLQL